jgi:SM-20-related protein
VQWQHVQKQLLQLLFIIDFILYTIYYFSKLHDNVYSNKPLSVSVQLLPKTSFIRLTFTATSNVFALIEIMPYEKLIQSYVDNQLGIDVNFISQELALSLNKRLVDVFNTHKMVQAGTGNKAAVHIDQLLRGDSIFWLDRTHENASENAFLDIIDAFVLHLNATCYAGITGYEFHFARYEEGSFYTKHFDRFEQNGDRAFSMITYLNPNWVLSDGGELCIHYPTTVTNIAPENCKCVFF